MKTKNLLTFSIYFPIYHCFHYFFYKFVTKTKDIMGEYSLEKEMETRLLIKINSRDKYAFCEVYDLLYRELHLYTLSLYRNYPVESTDVIHDVFVYVWQNKHLVFDSVQKFKSYMIVSIKNSFRNYINHTKYEAKYQDYILNRNCKYDLLEVEICSLVDEMLGVLPSDCAAILRMHLEGWSAEEISNKIGKKTQTVYNKKQEAISLLRKKFPNKLFLLHLFLILKNGSGLC